MYLYIEFSTNLGIDQISGHFFAPFACLTWQWLWANKQGTMGKSCNPLKKIHHVMQFQIKAKVLQSGTFSSTSNPCFWVGFFLWFDSFCMGLLWGSCLYFLILEFSDLKSCSCGHYVLVLSLLQLLWLISIYWIHIYRIN